MKNKNFTIREVQESDIQNLLNIYRPYVENTAISFETKVSSIDEFHQKITICLKNFPWLVAEKDGAIVGYAYAGKFRTRNAYNWSVESSVYVSKELQRQGIGKKLYHKLFEILKSQGIVNVFAGITLPDIGSIHLHESLGFKKIGIYKKVGFKFEKWWDVGWWQLEFSRPSHPKGIIPYSELRKLKR